MLRIALLIFGFFIQLHAIEPSELYGEWEAQKKGSTASSSTYEYNDLIINPTSFSLIIHLTYKQESYLIEDLQIEGKGIWKLSDGILIYVLSEVNTPRVEHLQNISQESINNFAEKIRQKYMSDPIRVLQIRSFQGNQFVITNEEGKTITYLRKL